MKKLPIYAPSDYFTAPQSIKDEHCNGCGAKGGLNVPDTLWGLRITIPCNIHDWMFAKGQTTGDYYFANAIFFWNMIALVVNGSNRFMMLLRAERALKYFLAVMFKSGRKAFWNEKNGTNERITITYRGEFRHV
jgi:hypothetical protein